MRLAAKCANAYAVGKLIKYVQPFRLEVGVQGGFKAFAHTVRRYVSSMPSGQVVAKLDFSNAFNNLNR